MHPTCPCRPHRQCFALLDRAVTKQVHLLAKMKRMPRESRDRPIAGSKTLTRGGWLFLLGLLSGCASVSPDTAQAPADEVPVAWSGAPQGALDARNAVAANAAWWQGFGDPVLSQLVAQARQSNTSVVAAQAALQQARALRNVAAAGLQPSVGSSASAQHGTRGSQSTGNNFQAGLDASWEVDFFGAQRSAVDTADASARASAASLGDVQLSMAAETGLNYIALRSGQERLALALDNLAAQQQTRQITEWRAQAGLLSALETQQARAATAQTAAQVPALQTNVTQLTQALAVLTGQAPAALNSLLAAPAPVPQPAADLALSLPADTLRQRPDVRAAEEQVRAAQGRVAQADAARYPSFTLGGSLGLSALTLGGLGSSALVSTLLARVNWPLWDGGAASAQVLAQRAALDQARASYRGAVLGALKDVEGALVALQGDRERVLNLQQAASAASTAATLADQRYRSGLVDFQTVLDTQRSRLSAQDSLASASADVSADHVRLFKALGGGWQADLQDNTAPATARTATSMNPPVPQPR